MMAKGVNKLKSGKAGVLDTWAFVEVDFGGADNRDLLQLYGVKLVDRHSGISENPDLLTAAALLAETAELAAPAGLPSPDVFLFLLHSLQELHEGVETAGFLCQRILEILALLGLSPTLENTDASPSATLWFSPANGGLLPSGSPRPSDQAHRLSPAMLLLLRSYRDTPEIARTAPLPEQEDCLTILGEFLCYHLDRPPKAWAILLERRKATSCS